MEGDFSRWTFDRHAAYRSVLLQQGRVLLDADWNEQTQITAHHDEIRMLDVVGRAGGPVGHAAFGITDAAGHPPKATAWADLRITPGRFYVDGVLAEVEADAAGAGPPLAVQPYLPGAALPGLPEPAPNGRYAVVLEIREDHVTADEAPKLRESALGGPDTTTRARTIWQLTLRKVEDDESCAGAQAAPWLRDEPPTMTASLADVPADTDPCRITTSAGYRRLENQLYRVQIHDVDDGNARYLWSRENGSVVAGLTGIGSSATMDSELSLDREGRDEELSIGPADIVEVTSAGRRLHGLPGFLARCGAPQGQTVPVEWLDDAPDDLASLGRAPIVRRWEDEPRRADGTQEALEDGIQVLFGAGDFRVGDYWLIPARTVRLVYGQTALAGTIEWPTGGGGAPLPQPPVGALRHRTVVALLDRATVGSDTRWTLRADCRRLTPPLTQLSSLDLLGGDGQEALPGTQLPHPIRVAVRNGGLPVEGARVKFVAAGGNLAKPPANATTTAPKQLPVETDANGHAEARWLLPSTGPATQSLTATLLDDAGASVGAQVRVSARLSVASQVQYNPAGCPDLASVGAGTVQQAIDELCRRHRDTFPGIHVEAVVSETDRERLLNDSVVELERLDEGLRVVFDEPIGAEYAKHPVLLLTVDVPWPLDAAERKQWGEELVGAQTITLGGRVEADDASIVWRPDDRIRAFLARLARAASKFEAPILARLTVMGNAVASEDGERFLNGRAFASLDDDRIDLVLPTGDDVHGADFRMWFWIARLERDRVSPRIDVAPSELVFVDEGEQLGASIQNLGDADLKFKVEAVTTSPPAGRIYEVSNPSGALSPGETQLLLVTSALAERGIVHAGQLLIHSNDPEQPEAIISLSSPGSPGIIVVPRGPFRLKPVRDEVVRVLTGPPQESPDPRRLRKELEARGQPLLLAVAPGFEDTFDAMRSRLADTGIEVERVEGDPAELALQAESGEIVLDGVIGDGTLANELAKARR
jgi:Family of unknown function (DUF6519)